MPRTAASSTDPAYYPTLASALHPRARLGIFFGTTQVLSSQLQQPRTDYAIDPLWLTFRDRGVDKQFEADFYQERRTRTRIARQLVQRAVHPV